MTSETATSISTPVRSQVSSITRAVGGLRLQDFAWVLVVVVLLLSSETNYDATILLILIGAFQIAEPRLTVFASRRGQFVSLTLKLVLSYLLLGWTHTIFSTFYPIFLLPVISAATTLELGGVLIVTAIACLSYFSFLLPIYIDWSVFELPPNHISVMATRASFFVIVAVLVFEEARGKRRQMAQTEQTARELAETNASLRKTEASLRRSERLAALGQLTAGLAHELRNPLGTIRASAEMMTKSTAQNRPELMVEMADYIRSEADRMNALVGHFLDFARPLRIHPSPSDFRAVVDNVFREQAVLSAERGISLEANGEAPLLFSFDADLMRLAISNLVQNAIQASRSGQRVILRYGQEQGQVKIVVADEGTGIDPEHLESIFNPFFTTKPQGIGLGLAIVAKIVDEHGGRVKAASRQGEGTTFEIHLPLEMAG